MTVENTPGLHHKWGSLVRVSGVAMETDTYHLSLYEVVILEIKHENFSPTISAFVIFNPKRFLFLFLAASKFSISYI